MLLTISLPLVEAVDSRIRAAASGDRRAVTSLLEQLLPRVRNLVRYLVRGDSEADDIAQDVLLELVRSFANYRGEGSLESWSDRITARTTFARLRRRTKERGRTSLLPPNLAAGGPEPDSYLMRRRAVELLDGLSFEQRSAFVLHHVAEMSIPEISEESGVPAETIRSRIRLAKARLFGLATHEEEGNE